MEKAPNSVLNIEALVGPFSQSLAEAFSVIVKTDRSFAALDV